VQAGGDGKQNVHQWSPRRTHGGKAQGAEAVAQSRTGRAEAKVLRDVALLRASKTQSEEK